MRKILCSVLAFLMLLSAFSCLTVTGFAANTVLTEIENNGSADTANEINVEVSNIGAIQQDGDVDWYKFTSDKDYFTVDFGVFDLSDTGSARNGWRISIYDSQMNLLINTYDVVNYESPELPVSGTMYIEVYAFNTYSPYVPCNIPYEIVINTKSDSHWESEKNNAAAEANLVSAGNPYTGALQSSDDVDWFKYNANKNYFTLDFGLKELGDKVKLSEAWDVAVYNENMTCIAAYYDTYSANVPPLAFTGTIYVSVSASAINSWDLPVNIPYKFTINEFEQSQWESEYNNDTTKANVIEYAKNYKGSFHSSSDVDVFKFKSTTDAFKIKFAIDLNETPADKVGDGWKITVFPVDSASSIVGNYVVSSIGSFETRTLPYEKGKEYFIKVEPAYTGSAPLHALYNIAVVDATDGKKWENENGGKDFKWATTVNKNEVVYGNMYSSDDNDYYKFVVPTDGVLNFVFNREESDKYNDGWNFALKDAAGNTVYTNSVTTALTLKSENINVKKGNYYLVVFSGYSAPESHIDYNIQLNYAMHTPKITKIANASNGITVNWNKTAGVASYILYRREYNATTKKWSSWKAIAKPAASATSFVDKTAKSGVSYRYTLRGVYGNLASSYVSTATLLCLAQPKATVKAVSNGINVAWTQSAGATGYTVYRMEYNTKTKKWSGWKNMGTTKKTAKSWTDKSAKKGVYYKYTVKAVNGKTASTYKASGSVKR